MPGQRKPLPRPCPQCGQENGGCQIVLFNPRLRPQRETRGYRTIAIIRISHYSKELFKLSSGKTKKNHTKIWHNFQLEWFGGIYVGLEYIPMNKIFVHPHFIKKKSLTLPLSKEWYEQIKTKGWSVIQSKVGFRNYKPHYIRKAGLEVCQRCNSVVKSLQKSGFSKLCDSCYSKEKALLEEWNKKRQMKAALNT